MKKNQHGFTAIEALIIVLVVALIGCVVYIVQDRISNKDDQKQSQSSVSTQGETNKEHATQEIKKGQPFVIKEWDVSAQLPESLTKGTTLQYKVESDQGLSFAGFTSQQLVSIDKDNCGADNKPAGAILRAKATDPYLSATGEETGQTVQEALTEDSTKQKIGEYYYWYQSSQASCSDKSGADMQQSEAAQVVHSVIKNLKAGY